MPNVTQESARALIRGLSNTENYPFHVEGEDRLAGVLVDSCAGVTHAKFVIAEFDEAERCPTVESLRTAARRLAEVCECGKAKWQHRDGTACRMFQEADNDGFTKTATGYAKFRESVPMIPGVPWEVALQVQSLKIGIRPRSKENPLSDDEKFPEACAAIRAGREPDYKVLEDRMRELFPWMWRGGVVRGFNPGTTDRLKQLDYFAQKA